MSLRRYLRIFDVIALLLQNREGLSLTEIKEALDLPISSLHNMLQTMVTAEVLTTSDDLRYFIGPRVVGMALATVATLDVRTLARRSLQVLAKAVGDDVYLAMKLGERVMYVDRWIGTQRISLDIRLGQPLVLHATATGKLFAAFDARLGARALEAPLSKLTANTITDAGKLEAEFKRIRARGFSKSNEEAVDGIVGYAVPIYDVDETMAAAIHISVLSGRASAEHERALISEALKAAEKAFEVIGTAPEALDALGAIFGMLARHERAAELFRRAVAARPEVPQYLVNLAATERMLGLLDDAEMHCTLALAQNPGYALAHYIRSDLRLQSAERNHIGEMESLLEGDGLDWRSAVLVRYALGKECEDVEADDRAFAHVAAGARLLRQHVAYDVRTDIAAVEGHIAMQNRSWLAALARRGSDAAPVFVCGLPRTGTTLVERIIGAHSAVESNTTKPSRIMPISFVPPSSSVDVHRRFPRPA